MPSLCNALIGLIVAAWLMRGGHLWGLLPYKPGTFGHSSLWCFCWALFWPLLTFVDPAARRITAEAEDPLGRHYRQSLRKIQWGAMRQRMR